MVWPLPFATRKHNSVVFGIPELGVDGSLVSRTVKKENSEERYMLTTEKKHVLMFGLDDVIVDGLQARGLKHV